VAQSFGKRGPVRAAYAPAQAFAPQQPAAAVSPAQTRATPAPAAIIRFPYLTIAILLVLTAVFIAELTYGVGPARALTPDHRTLIALGGLSADLVRSGEWWRLFTAPMLHGSPEHIVSNGIALLFAGVFLEPLIGRRWYAAIFVVGALGGALGSLAANPPQIITVGASGAIMGLLGATFVCSFSDAADEKTARRMRNIALRLIIPSLIPLAATAGSHVDFGAHLGGAAAGGIAGFVLQVIWPEGATRPGLPGLASAVSAVGAAIVALSFVLVARAYPVHAAYDDGLIPEAEMPASQSEYVARSADLVARYPRDPRAQLFRGLAFLEQNDLSDAEEHLRAAVSAPPDTMALMPSEIGDIAHFLLAVVLVGEGRVPEAKAIPASACTFAESREDLSKGLEILHRAGVCA
jgi:rhomboid protease GluP